MAMFKGFKPQAMQKIAGKMGYQGSMENFDNYLEQNPDKQREMIVYQDAAKQMARGGVVKMLQGGMLNALTSDLGSEVSPVQTMPESNFKGLANLVAETRNEIIHKTVAIHLRKTIYILIWISSTFA